MINVMSAVIMSKMKSINGVWRWLSLLSAATLATWRMLSGLARLAYGCRNGSSAGSAASISLCQRNAAEWRYRWLANWLAAGWLS
jgi:hypothetical protein